MATVHLVDASPYIFRAYFALPDSLVAPDGQPTNAIHGFFGFLVRLVEEEQPTHLGVAFDKSLTTSFRNEIYPEYKAQRDSPPAELEAQLGFCRELADAFGARTWASERYEADDLLASALAPLRKAGHGAVVVTNDKDMTQLVDERTSFLDFAKGLRLGPEDVRRKFGVRPGQIPDLFGLMGDSVDNIPGVRGIGPKTAKVLIQHFGDIDTLYARLDEVPSLALRGARGLPARLEAARADAFLSRELATVAVDAPGTDEGLAALRYAGADREALGALLERLGMSGSLGRVPRWRA